MTRFIIAILIIIPSFALANSIRINGYVVDQKTNIPIPFANIWDIESNTGTMSDADGKFTLKVSRSAKLKVSYIGYTAKTVRLANYNVQSPIVISLKSCTQDLGEVVVNARKEKKFHKSVFKRIIEHKNENIKNIKKIPEYATNKHTTVLFCTDSTSFIYTVMLNSKDAFITDPASGKDLIPIYSSDIKHKKDSSGFKHTSTESNGVFTNLNQYLESVVLNKLGTNFDFYDNQIVLFDRGFISPLSNTALVYYNIYLTDSAVIDDTKQFKFNYYPKNAHSVLFNGHFWVEDSTYALTSIEANISPSVNINFIENLKVSVNYTKQDNGTWFYDKQKTKLRMSLNNDDSSEASDNEINSGTYLINSTLKYIIPNASSSSATEITGKQQETLLTSSEYEKTQTNQSIDMIKESSVVKVADKFGNMFFTSYYGLGKNEKIELGPVYSLYTTNIIEGQRATLSLRTGEAISETKTVGGHVGYGFKSKEVKYGVNASFYLPTEKRNILTVAYSDDYYNTSDNQFIDFLKENEFSKGSGSFITSLTSEVTNPNVMNQKKVEVTLKSELTKNISLFIKPYLRRNYGNENIRFEKGDVTYNNFDTYGTLINLRIAIDQEYDDLYFSRMYYGDYAPVFNISCDIGRSSTPDQRNLPLYFMYNASLKHRLNMGQVYLQYIISAGYMSGTLPYTQLESPYGASSLGYSRFGFNLMSYTTFMHNAYSTAHLTLNGGGFVFNKIPFINRLDLREIISARSYIGKTTSKTTNLFDLPTSFATQQEAPYVEFGIGITNLFKMIRIEYVYLPDFSRINEVHSATQGIRCHFEMNF